MLAILWREIKLHYTKAYWLISNFTPPLFYLVFFGLLFSRAIQEIEINGISITYIHFFIPGLVVMQSFFIFSYTLALVNLDRRTKIIEMINATATSASEYFLGRMISVQLLAFMKILLLWSIAVIFLRLPIPNAFNLLLSIITYLISNIIWFSIGFIIGLLVKTEDVRDIVLQFLTLPLTFLSNIYYPINNAPGVLKYVIIINPLTHAVNIIRPALLGIQGITYFSLLILVIYMLTIVVLAYLIITRRLLYRN